MPRYFTKDVRRHHRRALISAVADQLKSLPSYHTFFAKNSPPSIVLAEKLKEIAPMPVGGVFYTNSGSEAVESAIKALWLINTSRGEAKRRKIITGGGAYHGSTIYAASMIGKDYISAFGLPVQEVIRTECPHFTKFALPGESEEDFVTRLCYSLESTIEKEWAETIAGFFAEPVMGAGGVIVPPATYFEKITVVLRRYDIPLVMDEIICGLGRTGLLWGSQHYKIAPDILLVSKAVTGGYFPLGAVLLSRTTTEKLRDACKYWEEFPHGFTTGGHPVGCAVGLAATEILSSLPMRSHVMAVSRIFEEMIDRLSEHELFFEGRAIGLMGALEIAKDKNTGEPFGSSVKVGDRFARAAHRNGLIIRPLGSSVVLAPPLICTEGDLAQIEDIILRTSDEVLSSVRADQART